MEEFQYLKYIFHEDLYLIEEQPLKDTSLNADIPEASQNDKQEPSFVKESEPITYFGNNEKGILILVEDINNTYLNQGDLDFLMRIIESGLRYSKNDFALVNTANFPLSQVLDEIQHRYIISFDIKEPIWKDKAFYQPLEQENIIYLTAHSLSEIASDKSKKRKLWEALKSMFDI